MPKLELVFTGMVAFKPRYQSKPVRAVTFVMLELQHARRSVNDASKRIPKHYPFVATHKDNLSSRPTRDVDFTPNGKDYVAWVLDKEQLTLANAPKKSNVTFDPNVAQNIIDSKNICGHLEMQDKWMKGKVKPDSRVGARFIVTQGSAKATGSLSRVAFNQGCKKKQAPWTGDITNELTVTIDTQDSYVEILSESLCPDEDPGALNDIRLEFGTRDRMRVYVGSGSLKSIAHLGYEETSRERMALMRPAGYPEVHFELFYDVGSSTKPPLPIPVYQSVKHPVPGTDRCPPKAG